MLIVIKAITNEKRGEQNSKERLKTRETSFIKQYHVQWKNKLLLTNIHIFVVITKTHALNVSMCACPYLCVEICAYVCFEGLVARP